MMKKKLLIISTLAFSFTAKAKDFGFSCIDNPSMTQKICFPFSKEFPINDFNKPWIVKSKTITLPNGSVFNHDIDPDEDIEYELKNYFNNPDIFFEEEPLLMAAWTEHDGDNPK